MYIVATVIYRFASFCVIYFYRAITVLYYVHSLFFCYFIYYMYIQGRPRDLAGGGSRNILLKFACRFCRGVRGHAPREFFLKWYVLVYILSLKNFKNYHFLYKNFKNCNILFEKINIFRYTIAMG